MAELEVRNGPRAGERVEIQNEEAVIGRYPFCDVVLNVHSVSRQHARITATSEGHFIEDLGSLNGTFLNGERVNGRVQLQDTDRIQVYETLMVFHGDELTEIPKLTKTQTTQDTANVACETIEVAGARIENSLDAHDALSVDRNAREKLQAVLSITRSLGSSLEIAEIQQKLLDTIFKIFPQSDRSYIMLLKGSVLELSDMKSRNTNDQGDITLGPLSTAVARQVVDTGTAILSTDSSFIDDDLDMSVSVLDTPFRSMMCAPLIGPSRKTLGVLYVDTNDPDNRFFGEDLEVMLSVTSVVGQAIEYTREHEANLILQRRQTDMAMAHDVQMHFLPDKTPNIPGYEFFHYYHSAEEIGGDYFGYIPMSDGRLAIAIGDVIGKGVTAGLMMARLCSEVRYMLAMEHRTAEAVKRLNQTLFELPDELRFITFSLLVLDRKNHALQIVNAGHLPPILHQSAGTTPQSLDAVGGMPLGVDADCEYTSCELQLERGDAVWLYTDGVNEAMSPEGEGFGNDRLLAAIQSGPRDVPQLGEHILANVASFRRNQRQSDDICLIGFSRCE